MTESRTERRERRIRIPKNPRRLAAAALALSVAGGVSACDPGEEQQEKSTVTHAIDTRVFGGDASWTDDTFNTRHAFDPLRDMVDETFLTEKQIAELKAKTAEFHDVGPVTADMQKDVADEVIVEYVLGNLNSSDSAEPGQTVAALSAELAGVDDQQEVLAEATSIRVGKALDSISSGSLEPEQVLPVLEQDGFTVTDEVKELADRADAAEALSGIYDYNSFLDAKSDIGDNADPEVSRLLQQTSDIALADHLSGEYSYGGITKAEFEQQAAAVKDKALRKLLRQVQQAIDTGDYRTQNKIHAAISRKYMVAFDARESFGAKVTKQVESVYDTDAILEAADDRKDAAMDVIDEAIDKEILDKNAQLEPAEMKKIELFPDGFATIDLTGVSSEKVIHYIDDEGLPNEYQQFGELRASSGQLELHFETTATIGVAQQEQIRRVIAGVTPMVEAAMKSGKLLSVRLAVNSGGTGTDHDFEPFFAPKDGTVYMVLPHNKSVSEDMLRGILTHETIHALFESAYSSAEASKKEIDGMKGACSALSDQARSQFEQSLKYSSEPIDNLIATSYGEDKRLFSAIKDLVVKEALNTVMNNISLKYADDFRWGCESPEFNSMINDIALTIDYKSDDSEPVSKQIITRYENNDDFGSFITVWYDAIEQYSLYAEFNESSHTQSLSQVTKALGHSEDVEMSGTEMPASLLNALLTKTKYMRQVYAGSTEAEKKTIEKATQASMAILINRYPNLEGALNDAYATMIG